MKNIHYPFLLPAVLVCGALAGCGSGNRQEQISQKGAPGGSPFEEVLYKGRLYTSSLLPEEAGKLGLDWPVYQISGPKSYFFSGHDTLNSYLGHCLALEGVEVLWPLGTEVWEGQYTYSRGGLKVSGLELLEEEVCSFPGLAEEKELPAHEQLQTYTGTIIRMQRPAPDIAYDYALRLEESFREENHPVQPEKWVEELPLVLPEVKDIVVLEKALRSNNKVTVVSARVQGYAESTALELVEVQLSRPEK